MCTAFEALLEIGKRGDSDGQVSKGLTRLFRVTAPDRVGAPSGASPPEEEPETLEQLRKWVAALYNIRNAYTHGKKVQDFDYLFCGRSIWVDCFEIFSLAANRVLLGNSERRLIQGIPLTKLLMSGIYLEELINELRKGRGIFDVQQSDPTVRVKLKKLLEKGMAVDPARIEQVRSLPQFREALYQLAGLIYYGLTKAAQEEISKSEISGLLSDLETAYEKTYDGSAKGGRSFDVSKYLRSVAPAITSMGYRALPVIGDDILLYQLTDNFKMMYRLYRDFENSQAPPSLQTRTPQPAN
jgi:hypothetical protein